MFKSINHSLIKKTAFIIEQLVVLLFCFSGILGAQEWRFVQTPINTSGGGMNGMFFLDKNNGWIVGNSNQGDIIHTINGGIDWTVQQTPVNAYLYGIFFTNADTGYAVGSRKGTSATIIFKTTDGGEHWSQQTSPIAKARLLDVCMAGKNHGCAVGQDINTLKTVILRTTDGQTWMKSVYPENTGNLAAVAFKDSAHGWVVGTNTFSKKPVIQCTIDGGQTWNEQSHPLTNGNLSDVVFVNPDSGWAVGNDSTGVIILKTVTGGANWTSAAAPVGDGISSIGFISPANGYLTITNWKTGISSILYKTINGGDSWIRFAEPVPDQYADKVQVVHGSIHIFVLFSEIIGILEEPSKLDSVAVNPVGQHVSPGGQQPYVAAGYDSNDETVPITPIWTCTGGDITQDGLFTAGPVMGEFTVTATDTATGIRGTTTVSITTKPVDAWVDSADVLIIQLEGNGNLEVKVQDGKVMINGKPIGDPAVEARNITGIQIHGGTGSNGIDLSGVKRADFTNLADGKIQINTGGGMDAVIGSEFGEVIEGGEGDDIVNGCDGSDTFKMVPGSVDTLIETSGDDAIDFSDALSGITIDMDLTYADQVVDAAGNTLCLEGQFENFIGSAFDDVVFANPLDAPRRFDGGAHSTGDILNFDAKGLPVIQTDSTLTVQGFGVVTYTGFETVNITGTGIEQVGEVPTAFALEQNHPNPFNPSTEIRFDVKESCRVVLTVLDLLGREIATVADDQYNPGRHSIQFDASSLPSGVYLYQIQMGDFTSVRKMVVMK